MEEENELLTVDQFAEGFKVKYPEFKDEENSVLTDRIISKYPKYKDMITFEEESNDLLSVDQFAEGFKEKYPQFKDDDNYDLTERIIAKYPQYKEQVDFQKKNPDDPMESISEDPSMDTTEENGAGEGSFLDKLGGYVGSMVDDFEEGVKERSKSRDNYEKGWSTSTGKATMGQLLVDGIYNTLTNTLPAEFQSTIQATPISNELSKINRGLDKAKANGDDSITILKNKQYQKLSLEEAKQRKAELQKDLNTSITSIAEKRKDSEEMTLASDGSYSEMFTAQGMTNLVATQLPRLGASVALPVFGSFAQIYGDTYMETLTAITAKENGIPEQDVTPNMMLKVIEDGKDARAISALSATLGSSLDLIGLGAITGKLNGPVVGFIKQHVKKGLTKGGKAGAKKAVSLAGDIVMAGNVAKGGLTEGITEGAQSAIQQVGKLVALGNPINDAFNSLNWDQIFKEGIAGALMGGPISGGSSPGIKFSSNDVEAMIAEYDVGALKQFTEEGMIDWNTIPERTKSKVRFLEKIKGEKVLPIPSAINKETDVEVDVKEDVDIEEQVDEQTTTDTEGVPSMDEGAESNVEQVDGETKPGTEESTDQQEQVVPPSSKGLLSVDEGGKAELTTEDGRIIELGNIEDEKSLEELGLSFEQTSVQPMGGSLYNVDGKELRLRDGEQFKFSKKGRTVILYDDNNKPVKITGNQAEELEYFSKLSDTDKQEDVRQNPTKYHYHTGTLKEKDNYTAEPSEFESKDEPLTGHYFSTSDKDSRGDKNKEKSSERRAVDFGKYKLLKIGADSFKQVKGQLKDLAIYLGKYSENRLRTDIPLTPRQIIDSINNAELRLELNKLAKGELVNFGSEWAIENGLATNRSNNNKDADPSRIESLETFILKKLGYDGIEIQGSSEQKGDASSEIQQEGSIIFDLKPETVVVLSEDSQKPSNRTKAPTTLKEASESIYNSYSIVDSNDKPGVSNESQVIVKEEAQEGNDIILKPEMAVDDKSRGKLYEFLDKKDKELTKFGKENLSFGLPIAVAQGTIKTMKLAIETAQTGADIIKAGVDYIKNTDWYKNQTKAKKAEIDTAIGDEKNFINLVGETPTKPPKANARIERLKDTSRRLRKQFNDLREYKKNLIDNIYEKLELKTLDNLSNYFNKPIFRQINNAKTAGAVDRLISKIDYKIVNEELKKVDQAIGKFFSERKKFVKSVEGKPKGNVVDNETRKLITETINTKLGEDLNVLEKQAAKIELGLGGMSDADFDKASNELTAIEIAINLKKADDLIKNSKALRKEKNDNPKSFTADEKADFRENVDLTAEGIRLKEQALNDLIALRDEGKSNLKEEIKKEAERLRALQDKALEDTNHALSGMDSSTLDKKKEARGKFVNTFLKALSKVKSFAASNVLTSLEFLLKVVSNNSDIDKGFLRNYFFVEKTGFTEARQNASQEKRANSDALRDFIFKTFNVKGSFKEFKFLTWVEGARDLKVTKSGIFIKNKDGELEERPMSKLNALSIYQWSKMDGVASNLEEAGYTDESIEQVKQFLGEKYIALGDFMTDFLKSKFPEYNKQYRSIMRTDVNEVENYFPVNYNKEQLSNEVDVEDTKANYLASITPSHTISRVSNNNKLNDNADALDLFNNYLEVMTQFKHYSRPIKDMNSVLSNKQFKFNLETLSEDGKLYGQLKDAVGGVVGARVIESNKEAANAGRDLYKIQRGIQLTYVGFKAYTAAKQLLSFFAAYEYANSVRANIKGKSYRIPFAGTALFTGKLIWDLPKAYQSYKFLYDKSTGFKDRVDSGDVGSESIRRALDGARTSKFNLAQKMAAKFGLFLNRAVDTFTIAWTGKTLYDQQMKMYKENGLTQKQANEKAIRDFEVYFTLSQQSSDPELLSSSQRDKGFIGLFSAFKNAQQSYFRKIAGSFTSLLNSYKNEKTRLEKLGRKNPGRKALVKIASTDADQNNVKKIMLYGYVMPLAWQYVASGLPGLLTKWDDDDEYEMKRTLFLVL